MLALLWASIIYEGRFGDNTNATRHAIAISLAAAECGLFDQVQNEKLVFKIAVTRAQLEAGPKSNGIKARADIILRKFNRAMDSDGEWLMMMSAAIINAFWGQDQGTAAALAWANCAAVGELEFFNRSLQPFIAGRFDPAKRVKFSLPDFMPNFF
jgi:hypothetical protein